MRDTHDTHDTHDIADMHDMHDTKPRYTVYLSKTPAPRERAAATGEQTRAAASLSLPLGVFVR